MRVAAALRMHRTYTCMCRHSERPLSIVRFLQTADCSVTSTCRTEPEYSNPPPSCAGCVHAGKSSLVEAISSVALPRNSSTCTRCPAELRLLRRHPAGGATAAANGTNGAPAAAPWRCTVKLSVTHETGTDRKLAKPLPEKEFAVVYSPQHVQACVAAAQVGACWQPRRVAATGWACPHCVMCAALQQTEGCKRLNRSLCSCGGADWGVQRTSHLIGGSWLLDLVKLAMHGAIWSN